MPAPYMRAYNMPDHLLFPNLHYINAQKQRAVADFISNVCRDESVEWILVFGSSVSDACNGLWSDVDVVVNGSNRHLDIPTGESYDVLFRDDIPAGDPILNTLEEDGVVVFRRHVVGR